MRQSVRVALVPLALLASLGVSRVARASDPVAEAMFQEAAGLMGEGRLAEACPKLETSQKREARSGTLLLLASCHEQLGRSATAWVEYKDAIGLAKREGRQDNEDKATTLAQALEPKLSRLRLDAPAMPGIELALELDGAPVSLGSLIPVDPGDHTLKISAPGRKERSLTVSIGKEPETKTLAIAELEKAPDVPPAPQAPAPEHAPGAPAAGGVPAWAWVTGGLGLASLGVAVGMRIDQSATSNSIDDLCGEGRKHCPPTSDFDAMYARETRDFGLFVGFGIGGVALLATGLAGVALGASSGGDDAQATGAAAAVVLLAPTAGGAVVSIAGELE
ncbi:MAG: hypothetical protein IT373_14560 [Polyangiaceae bacterium]|nr:hypothetical protein [Polyangiaceae bacterium]